MSILYNFRILQSKNKSIPSDDLFELHTDSSRKNLRPELKQLNIDTSQEEKVIRFHRFKEILHENIKSEDEIFNAFKNFPVINKNAIMNIENQYSNRGNELFYCESFIYHKLLSEMFPDKFTSFDITEVILEIISIHPDSEYPKKRMNDRVLQNDRKRFAARLLTDIYPGADEKAKNDLIFKFFEERIKGGFYDSDLEDFDKIVWGIETIENIKIKPTGKAFWKKHENVWWKQCFNDYAESDNKPYEYNKLRIVLPLGWFPEFANGSEIFDSTAF